MLAQLINNFHYKMTKEDSLNIEKIINIFHKNIDNIILYSHFKNLDLFESKTPSQIKEYNMHKLVLLIKKVIKICKKQNMYFQGRCNTNDIFFIPMLEKRNTQFFCKKCHSKLTHHNSINIGMSETTGTDYICLNCHTINDTGPEPMSYI